jgi:Zn-dependent peptidase ImmA (M78 family)
MANKHTDSEIEKRSLKVLQEAGALLAPVAVEKVAGFLDAQVHYQALEEDVSGLLAIKGQAKHIIVNSEHHTNRRRFTVAHELGHLVLHDGSGDRLFIDKQLRVYQRVGPATSPPYTSENASTTPQEEREANKFASCLLMPAVLLSQAVADVDLFDEVSVARLAMLFEVSEQAMSIRLQQLNLVSI